MPRSPARFFLLASTGVGLLLALEFLCRVAPAGLTAVAHRVRFKLALLHAKPGVELVVLGSSRSNDGVSPRALALGPAFNTATPSTSLPTLEHVASRVGPRKLALVEVSQPQFQATPFDGDATPVRVEGDPLGAWLHEHSALLPVRHAFALENLPRVAALLAASRFDGSEWFRTRFLVAFLQDDAPLEGVHDEWKPAVLPTEPVTLDEDGERIVAGYTRALDALENGGAKVVLVSPPVASSRRVAECEPPRIALRAELARRVRAPLLDFTCAAIDDRWFFDGEHLTSPGRRQFSQVLGEAVRALP